VDRDRYMSAEEAKAYGLIDAVLTPTKTVGGNGAPKLDG
jgi:ATP-dependent protease ClpP protease subunit